MTRRWTVMLPLLLLGVLASGCFQNMDIFCGSPCPGKVGSGNRPDSRPFLGTWLNEDPKIGQVTRIEVYEKTVGIEKRIYTRIWEMCSLEDCAFEEYEALLAHQPWTGGRTWIATHGSRPDSERGVSLRLYLPVDARAQAEVTVYINGVQLETEIYYFYKAQS